MSFRRLGRGEYFASLFGATKNYLPLKEAPNVLAKCAKHPKVEVFLMVFNLRYLDNMEVPKQEYPRIKKICQHEAAHLVAAKQMKFETCGISLGVAPNMEHSGAAGIVLWKQQIKSIEDLQDYLKRRIVVLYAGVIAQFIEESGKYDEKGAEKEWENAGAEDCAKISESLQTLRNISFPKTSEEIKYLAELKEFREGFIDQTKELVVKRYAVIEAIACKLAEKIVLYKSKFTLTEKEISEIAEVKEFLRELEK